ncbi:hypothetical protein PR202_ga27330 [Eleusine coracana subsp. coracana]|uniref:Uncharacterized protein n=1 Tax=Eleusine coracana subsp. coracana TaxID=191504 RepID=A0AAV5DFX6_ELECO|nr:hypothetical protein PR202_ga27330 [Eleusine coracana subsp. coracana]
MDPNYESAEEMDAKTSVGVNANRSRTYTSVSRRKSKYPKSTLTQKIDEADHHSNYLSTESTMRGSRTERKFKNFHHTNGTDIPRTNSMSEAGSVSSSVLTMSGETEPEKVWHYKDPSGNVQGPFTLLQLSKWTSYFPRDLRVWLTFESEERSLLLTEVLSKQQTVFTQTTSVTISTKATSAGIENKNNLNLDQINALSPTGYSLLNSSVITLQSNKYSVPERESVNSPEDCLSLSTSSIPPKYVHTLNSQVQCQTKQSAFVQSPGSPCGQTDLHHDGAHGGCSGESNHRHSNIALKSSIMAQTSYDGKSNVASHHQYQHTSWSHQNDSKNSSQGVSVKDISKNLPTRVGKDAPSPVFAWSPSESRTASSQHDGSCLSSTTNPNFLDEHHSSIASAKPKCCAPATPIEDRGSSSPSGMLSHSERVPICSPQSAPSASVSDMCKIEEIINQQRTLDPDTLNASVNQSPESKIFPVSSPDNQDIDREFPSPTPRPENEEPVVDNSGLKPASPENLAVSHSCKMEEIVNQHKILEAGASNPSANHYPQSEVLHVSSSNDKDLEPESARSDNKEPAMDNSLLTLTATANLTMASASDSDTCKMEAPVNQQKTLEEDVSNGSINRSPRSNIFPVSSTDNQDIEHAHPDPTPRSENKEPTENLGTASASDTDTCKMEETMNHQKTPEEDISDASIKRSPCSNVFLVSSTDNQDIERAYPIPTPRSRNKEPTENLRTTSASNTDSCKMEATMNQQKTLEEDISDASVNRSPCSNIFPVSSTDKQDIEHTCPSPTPRSGNKEPSMDTSGLMSVAPENLSTGTNASNACKMEEILDKKVTIDIDASSGSITPPSKVSLVSSPDNRDIEQEFPGSAPKSENKEPLVDNSVLTSSAPENETTTSASTTVGCKMEVLDKKTTLETGASNGSVAPSPRSEDFLVTSDNQNIQRGCPSPNPRPENKEPIVDTTMLILEAPDNLTTEVPGESPDAFALPKSGPPIGKLDAMESEFKGVEEIIQNGLYSESTVVTKGDMVIDPSCGAESIDVSDVLESLMEQRCETSYMHGTTALEDFLAASDEEEPQCSSPIALSPWGEPSYYQGDAVDSALWGVEDDSINAMWSLLSQTPTLQPSSGPGTKASETLDINEVALSHGINDFFQRGPMLGEEHVKNATLGATTDWVLPGQVKSKPNDVSASSVDENRGIVGWQPSANQNLSAGTASGIGHNLYLPGCEKTSILSKSSSEASRKQESTGVSSSGEAIGNTNKSWNPPVIASRGEQKNHRRGRYSEISESWLLSSNNTRSRSDRFGTGGSSRSTSNGRSRVVCKFHEGGYCRKGASCSYLHT